MAPAICQKCYRTLNAKDAHSRVSPILRRRLLVTTAAMALAALAMFVL